jgi:hypothetical protein
VSTEAKLNKEMEKRVREKELKRERERECGEQMLGQEAR